MKDDHQLDQLFREGLANHPTPAPEYLWDGIEARRFGAKAAKNTNKYWLLLLLLFISVGGYGTWMYINVDADQQAVSQKKTAYNSTTNKASHYNPVTNKASNNNAILNEANSSSASQNGATVIESGPNTSKNDQNKRLNSSITPKTKKELTKEAKARAKAKAAKKAQKIAPSEIATKNINDRSNKDASMMTSWKLENPQISKAFFSDKTSWKLENPQTSNASTPNPTAIAFASNQEESESEKSSSIHQKRKFVNEMPMNNGTNTFAFRKIFLDDKFTLEKKRVKKRVADECYSFLPSRHKGLTFEAYYGPDYNIRTLTEKTVSSSTSENFGHFVARDTSESRWYSYSAGIRLNLYLKGGLHLKTGINATRISERFDYVDNEIRYVTERNVDTTYDSSGNIYIDTQITERYIIGKRTVTNHIKHRLIDIPVLLGYELELPNRFSFSLTGGVLLNILYFKKGKMIGQDTNLPTPYSSNNSRNSEYFNRRAGLSAYASFIAYYKLQSNMHIMLEPSFRHYTDSFTKSTYQLEQRYSSLGLKLGMRYVF